MIGTGSTIPTNSEQALALVEKKVRDHWQQYGKAITLQALGSVVNQEIGRGAIKALFPYGLKVLIAHRFHDKFKLVQHPDSRETIAVIPKEVSVPTDLRMLFVPSQSKVETQAPILSTISTSDARAPYVRYKRAFWGAFAKPVPDGFRRFVILSPSVKFEDRLSTLQPPSDGVEVDAEMVPVPELPEPGRTKVVYDNIEKWLARHSTIDRSILIDDAPRPVAPDSVDAPSGTSMPKSSLAVFRDALELIDPQDLARIQVPADVLLRLLRK